MERQGAKRPGEEERRRLGIWDGRGRGQGTGEGVVKAVRVAGDGWGGRGGDAEGFFSLCQAVEAEFHGVTQKNLLFFYFLFFPSESL